MIKYSQKRSLKTVRQGKEKKGNSKADRNRQPKISRRKELERNSRRQNIILDNITSQK
jgi:hypothetical protein